MSQTHRMYQISKKPSTVKATPWHVKSDNQDGYQKWHPSWQANWMAMESAAQNRYVVWVP